MSSSGGIKVLRGVEKQWIGKRTRVGKIGGGEYVYFEGGMEREGIDERKKNGCWRWSVIR